MTKEKKEQWAYIDAKPDAGFKKIVIGVAIAIVALLLILAIGSKFLKSPAPANIEPAAETSNSNTLASLKAMDLSNIDYVTESSYYIGEKGIYTGANVFDGDMSTCWQDGSEGNAKGEIITVYFKKQSTISLIAYTGGKHTKVESYYNNCRPSKITLEFANGKSQSFDIEDVYNTQLLFLDEPCTTDYVKVHIDGVYDAKYEDNCISEITFY